MGITDLMTFPWNFFQSNERKTHENLISGNPLTLKTGLQKTMDNFIKMFLVNMCISPLPASSPQQLSAEWLLEHGKKTPIRLGRGLQGSAAWSSTLLFQSWASQTTFLGPVSPPVKWG